MPKYEGNEGMEEPPVVMTHAKTLTLEEVVMEAYMNNIGKFITKWNSRKFGADRSDLSKMMVQAIATAVRQHYKECLSVAEIAMTVRKIVNSKKENEDEGVVAENDPDLLKLYNEIALAISSKVGEV